jgi:hypothetical protein
VSLDRFCEVLGIGKYKFTRTSPSGHLAEVIQWEATDLHGFAIKTEVRNGKDSVTTTYYKNINTNKPDPGLFVPPADYKRYGSENELSKTVHYLTAPANK